MTDLLKPVDRVVALVEKLIGPPLDEAGKTLGDLVGMAFADKVHLARERKKKNFEQVLQKVERNVEQAQIEIQSVPLRLLEPIFSNASLEDDDYLQERWAALLTNAASPGAESVPPAFPEILKQLTPREAKLLQGIYENVCAALDQVEHARSPALACSVTFDTWQDFLDIYKIRQLADIQYAEINGDAFVEMNQAWSEFCVTFSNFYRLGLIGSDLHIPIVNKPADFQPQKVHLTAFGFQFVRACTPPKPRQQAV